MPRILIYVLFFLPFSAVGQESWCNVDHRFNLSKDDEAYQRHLSHVREREERSPVTSRTDRYFPVVIHVVARDVHQPVTIAQALQQLDVLNDDFAGKGDNISKLLPEFSSLSADTEIKFCLASVDPDGFPTSGITFTQTDTVNIALVTGPEGRLVIHYDQLGGKTGWDPARYINIWVAEYGGILGSASFPGMAAFPEEIGLIMDIRHFGSIGDAGHSGIYGRGHTLTHEMGHFFGLKHIWGNGEEEDCDDSDDIDDTPNAAGPYLDCPSGIRSSCGTSDMYQNFMDLTDDRCLATFTRGQATRMQAVIDLYYPDMAVEGSCKSYSSGFTAWFDQLIWSHDRSSNKYVIHSPQGLMGNKQVTVYSADGRIILKDRWEGQLSYLLDLNQAGAGIYFVCVFHGMTSFVRKLIVY